MNDEISIRLAAGHADFDACVELQRAVWGLADLEITSSIQLIATTLAGGMVQLARDASGRAVGFAYAFPALLEGAAHLHSDMLAVLPEQQRRGVGVGLKWAQREEALRRGVRLLTWTFDPLQARNAHLNLRRLGARASEFLENVYGITSSALHHGLPTDRLWVRWELDAPRVAERAAAGEPAPTVETPELPRVNEVKWQAGWPVSSGADLTLDAPKLLLELPPDFDVLSQAAPRVAQDWHSKVRSALREYFGRGYQAVDFLPTEDKGRRRPYYLLARS
ncbi:MAG: GNAT family N-acetyltransferase [Vicinamibacteria bacterium]